MAATTFGRPVAARANLIAASTASVPEFERKTEWREGGVARINRWRNSVRAGTSNPLPRKRSSAAWRWIAVTTAGWETPRFPTPWEAPRSMNRRPASSKR